MSSRKLPDPALAEVRQHHLGRVNDVLRRPGVYGRDEIAERLMLEAMAAVDGTLSRWRAACDGLRDRDAFAATGVSGAYRNILPADALRDATTSMYTEIAHHLGWLELDRALTTAEREQVDDLIGGWVTQDRTLPEVIETFGSPSLWIGGTNPYWPKTLAYTTADRNDDLICFDTLDAALAWAAEHQVTGILAEYRFGGTYDVAVNEGRFTPSKGHHGTADHVGTFSPGYVTST